MNHVTYVHTLRRTCKEVMTQIDRALRGSIHRVSTVYKRVMSRISTRHVAHTKKSCQTSSRLFVG